MIRDSGDTSHIWIGSYEFVFLLFFFPKNWRYTITYTHWASEHIKSSFLSLVGYHRLPLTSLRCQVTLFRLYFNLSSVYVRRSKVAVISMLEIYVIARYLIMYFHHERHKQLCLYALRVYLLELPLYYGLQQEISFES